VCAWAKLLSCSCSSVRVCVHVHVFCTKKEDGGKGNFFVFALSTLIILRIFVFFIISLWYVTDVLYVCMYVCMYVC